VVASSGRGTSKSTWRNGDATSAGSPRTCSDRQSVLDTVVAGKHAQTLKAQRSGLRYSESDEDRAHRLLERVNLRNHADKRFSELSQGQSQLVLVGRCLMGDPELLVFDEPCAGLDPGSREDFLAVLDRVLAEEIETTVLYVTHHVEEILPEFTKLLVLRNGSVQYAGPKEDFLGDEQLDGVYSEDFELTRKNGRYWPIGRS
jgi:iron complex transport system ATP-binding protein